MEEEKGWTKKRPSTRTSTPDWSRTSRVTSDIFLSYDESRSSVDEIITTHAARASAGTAPPGPP